MMTFANAETSQKHVKHWRKRKTTATADGTVTDCHTQDLS